MRTMLPYACDRTAISDSSVEILINAALKDMVIIKKDDFSKVVDRSKIRRIRGNPVNVAGTPSTIKEQSPPKFGISPSLDLEPRHLLRRTNHPPAVIIPLDKKELAIIVKLVYENDRNPSAAFRASRRMKRLRRCPMSVKAIKSSKTQGRSQMPPQPHHQI
ncbi:hypothetical protein AVEN_255218-1 [Araneus ventricosus]|uniref:DUF4817 domain-containing protein n=1 Tax=Araneus ventricosus TaxID=182803 RepID=A0A4Y2B9Q2_ARAVE|nr:hypothetical protein AVEN_255218-1 [Araneus ventricosus]